MRRGYKLYCYVKVLKNMINKIIYGRIFKKSNAPVYKFKQHPFTRKVLGDYCC